MPRPLRLALTIALFWLLWGSMHFYVQTRCFADPAWPAPLPTLGAAVLAALALNFGYVFASRDRHRLPAQLSRFLRDTAYLWLGIVFLLTLVLAAVDVFSWAWEHWGTLQPSTLALARGKALGAIILSVGLTALGLRGALGSVRLKRQPVTLANWPQALTGFRIIQLSDVHIGPTLKAPWLRRVVATVNAQQPDLVVITGDLIDGTVAALASEVAPLAELRPKHGVFFVTGNHEFYHGADDWVVHLQTLGVQVLAGQYTTINTVGGSFDLLGLHDRSSRHWGSRYQVDLKALLGDRDHHRPLIALAHQPVMVHTLAPQGVNLQLSGHTHGGQIWPFTLLVALDCKYVAGLYRHSWQTQLYVSRGTGFWGPPLRLFAPAEITELIIHSKC